MIVEVLKLDNFHEELTSYRSHDQETGIFSFYFKHLKDSNRLIRICVDKERDTIEQSFWCVDIDEPVKTPEVPKISYVDAFFSYIEDCLAVFRFSKKENVKDSIETPVKAPADAPVMKISVKILDADVYYIKQFKTIFYKMDTPSTKWEPFVEYVNA